MAILMLLMADDASCGWMLLIRKLDEAAAVVGHVAGEKMLTPQGMCLCAAGLLLLATTATDIPHAELSSLFDFIYRPYEI